MPRDYEALRALEARNEALDDIEGATCRRSASGKMPEWLRRDHWRDLLAAALV